MPDQTATPSIGEKLGFEYDDEPMAEFPAHIEPSEEQMRHFEQTGTVALPMQTVGPNAKELERRRLHAGGRTRQTSPRTSTRPRTGTRPRGAGRPKGQATRSSAKSGDSGEDELAEPPAGPAERRPSDRSRTTCNRDGCNNSIEHLARQAWFCDDRGCVNKREAARKAASRKREHESEAERDFEDGAFEQPKLCGCKPPIDLEGRRPIEFEHNHCARCGRDLEHLPAGRAHDSGPLKSRLIVVHTRCRPHRPERYGDRKRKPVEHKPLPSGEVVPM